MWLLSFHFLHRWASSFSRQTSAEQNVASLESTYYQTVTNTVGCNRGFSPRAATETDATKQRHTPNKFIQETDLNPEIIQREGPNPTRQTLFMIVQHVREQFTLQKGLVGSRMEANLQVSLQKHGVPAALY